MAKTSVSRGRTTRQSRRLNPDLVEAEEHVSPENPAKDKEEGDQEAVEDKPKSEVTKEESDPKLATGDVQEEQAESAPVTEETKDQPKDEPEDVTTVEEDKPEPGVEADESTSTDVASRPDETLSEEIKADEVEQMETSSSDVQVKPEVTLQEEIKDEEDVDTEAVIEVKGSSSTVNVSWEKDAESEEDETEAEDLTRTDQTAPSNEEQAEITSSTEAQEEREAPPTEEIKDADEEEKAPDEEVVLIESDQEQIEEKDDDIEIIEGQDVEEAEDEADVDMEPAAAEQKESEKTDRVEERLEEEEDDRSKATEVRKKRKRKPKPKPSTDPSPPKKVKLINDGFCLYVGNLDSSRFYEDIRNALEKCFMTRSLLVQDIRLDKAKRHAFVDVASQLDLNKALELNGEKLLDKPMSIARARVREVDLDKKKKSPQEVQKSKNERCLHVENVPSSATKDDLVKLFPKATAVRFLGENKSQRKGVAFVEFQSKSQADAARTQSETIQVQIQDHVLKVDQVKESAAVHRGTTNKNKTKGDAPPSNTLFVGNLPATVQEKQLKMIFKKAVKINIPHRDGSSRRFAFVEFATVAQAQKALKSSRNSSIDKRRLKVQFGLKSKPEQVPVPSKTLIVLGLHESTTADTLTQAFDGALTSRIFVDKDTGLSRKFGFVDFESVESCSRAKAAAEDVEIDGRTVTVAFARTKPSPTPDPTETGLHRQGQVKGDKAGKKRKAARLKKPQSIK